MDIAAPMAVLVLTLVPILPILPLFLFAPPPQYAISTLSSPPLYISLSLLPHIGHLTIKPSDGLGPGIAPYIPCLSHHPLSLFDLTYEWLGPVPGIYPLAIVRPQPPPDIPPSSQQVIKPPLQTNGCLLTLPPALLGTSLCVRYGGTL